MDLETTLEDLAPRLLRYCLGRSGDPALAEEAAQDALAALLGRWRRLGPPEDAAAFVFVVARRRLGRRLLRRRLLLPLEAIAGRRSTTPDPEASTVAGDETRAALDALDRLPAGEREALLLVAAGELDGKDAAELLGIDHSAFKMRVHRARKRLRRLLEERHERLTTQTT